MNVIQDEFQADLDRSDGHSAYADLVHRHLRRVFAICLSLLGEPANAEDAVQEVFVKGFERIGSLRDREKFGAWIGQIARNHCRDILRANQRRTEQPLSPVIDNRADKSGDDFADLKVALAHLSEEHRLPLLLYYFDGRDTKAIALQLGMTQGGVCARLHRARRQLRALLEEDPRKGGDPHE